MNKEDIKLTIVIPTYNRIKLLIKLLDKLIHDKYVYEIIIIDDHSTDNTFKLISKLMKSTKKIRLFFNINKYQTAAKELGIKESTGNFITFLDDDSLPLKNWTTELYKSILDGENIIQAGILSKRKNEKWIKKDVFLQGKILWNMETLTNWNYGVLPKYVNLCQECGLTVKKEIFDYVNLSDVGLLGDGNGESISFSFRLAEKGYKILFNPSIKFIHFDCTFGGSKDRFGKGKVIKKCTEFQKFAFYNRLYLVKRFKSFFLIPSVFYYLFKCFISFCLTRNLKCIKYPLSGMIMFFKK